MFFNKIVPTDHPNKKWEVLSRHTPDAAGRISTSVPMPDAKNSFAFAFIPASGTGYIASAALMQINVEAPNTTKAMRLKSIEAFRSASTSRSRRLAARAIRG